MNKNNHEYEKVETNHGVFYVCLDCGAVGVKVGKRMVIRHYKNCHPVWDDPNFQFQYKEAQKEDER